MKETPSEYIRQYQRAATELKRIDQLNKPTQKINRSIRKQNRVTRDHNERIKADALRGGRNPRTCEIIETQTLRTLPHRAPDWASVIFERESRLREELSDKHPSDWEAEINSITNVHVRNKVGRIVWWDYFSDSLSTNRVHHFDQYMHRTKTLIDPPNREVKQSLMMCGYTPVQAEARVTNINYEIDQLEGAQ